MMASQALYRKWRSQTFETVIGQEHVALTLRNALRDGRMSHAYLFTGPRGTGKTSTARILAKAINCLHESPAQRPCNSCAICTAINEGRLLDLIEIDAASNRGIDEIRDLREKIQFRPNEARYKVYIIDEVHMLTKEAFNALLKTLEEPPAHAVFVLATTEPDRVPETVRSRCQRFDFRRIPTAEIVEHLGHMVQSEGGKAESEALVAIARRSTGSMRDAISLLDQLLSYGDETLTLARVEAVLGLVSQGTIGALVDHMAEGSTGEGLALLNRLVAEGVELGQLVDQVVAYLRGVMMVRIAKSPDLLDLPQDVRSQMTRQAQRISTPVLLAAIREWTEARGALRDQVPGVPQLPLEVAFLRSAPAETAPVMATATATAAPAASLAAAATTTGTAAAATKAAPAEAAADPSPASPGPARSTVENASGRAQAAHPPGPKAPSVQEPPAELRSTRQAGPTIQSTPDRADQPPATGEDLQARVNANWDRFMARLRQQYGIKIQAALRNVKEVVVAGRTLELQFGAAHGFSRDVVNEAENRLHVEDVWRQVLGEDVNVRCTLVGATAAIKTAEPRDESRESGGDALLEDAKNRGAVITPLD